MFNYTEKHQRNEILQVLGDEIRMRVHKFEDLLETYIVEESLYRNKHLLGKAATFPHRIQSLRTVGQAVQKLTEDLRDTYNQNKEIGIPLLRIEEFKTLAAILDDNKKRKEQHGKSEPLVDRTIGFEDAVDEVLKLLGVKKPVRGKSEVEKQSTSEVSASEAGQISKSQPLEVVSIHGMLGLGKTTVARKVMNHPMIEFLFDTRIFVSLSKEYKKEEVLLSILSVFIKDIRCEKKSMPQLVEMVKKELKEHKYFIVVDDVGRKEAWDDLKTAFPENNKGSRVLITTEDSRVAMLAKTKSEPYLLRFMKEEEAKELLRIKVFNENECPTYLHPLEEKILAKCDKLPLAIVVTAGILRDDPRNEKWWNNVLHGLNNLVGDEQAKSDAIVKLSYDNLPNQLLKLAFLYLGVFPEDLEIHVPRLLQLWIAEGFIPQPETADIDVMAELFFSELVNRNLVIVRQRTLSGEIKTCRIHDMLRDFCKKTAKKQELFQVIHGNVSISSSNRRLCCRSSHFSQYICSDPPAENVRSFLSFGKDETTLEKDLCLRVFKPFKLLRVLDILSINLPGDFPSELSKLVLLKFIAICCELKILPKKLSILLNLQTLIIQTTSPTLKIEADIWEMKRLRHLYTNASTILPKCQKQSSDLDNLQTLSTISPESLTNEVLKKATKLKKLGIRGILGTLVTANGDSSLFDSLCKLDCLENLKLHSDKEKSKLLTLPQPNHFPITLKRLTLQNTSLHWNHMSIVGKLQHLEVLKLKDNAFKGENWQTEEGGFPSLKALLMRATDLKNWEADAENFPELRSLSLKHCKKLEYIPPDFANMKNLKTINLEHTNASLVKSAWRIVQHRLEMLRWQKDTKTSPIKLNVFPLEE